MNSVRAHALSLMLMLLLLLTISSCKEKEDSSDIDLSEYVGEYRLDYANWLGSTVDINRDGNVTWFPLKEMSGMPGFVQSWIKGTVEQIDDRTLHYSTVVPACVTDLSTRKSAIIYYGIEKDATWHAEWGNPQFVPDCFYLRQIDSISAPTENQLWIYDNTKYDMIVTCTFPGGDEKLSDENGLVHGQMIYTFKKVK